MSCPCNTPAPEQPHSDSNCCPTSFCHDSLMSLPEATRMNVTGVRSGSKCLNVFPRTKPGFLVQDGNGGAIVTKQPQVQVPYLRTLLYDAHGQPIMNEAGNPEEDNPPPADSLLVSGDCGLQWRYRGRAGYRQKLYWDGCKWVTENDAPNDLESYPSVYNGKRDCDYYPMALIRQDDGTYKQGYRQTHYRIPGEVISFAGPIGKVPQDWLLCDGSSYDPEVYTALYNKIGNTWGTDGDNFLVPDFPTGFPAGTRYIIYAGCTEE